VKIMGAPVGGNQQWREEQLYKLAVNKHERMRRQLLQMGKQNGHIILSATTIPRMGHLGRCVPVLDLKDAANEFDMKNVENLKQLACSEELSTEFVQAPVNSGGMGFRSQAKTAAAANISSIMLCADVLRRRIPVLDDYVRDLEEHVDELGPDDGEFMTSGEMEELVYQAETSDNKILLWLLQAWSELRELGVEESIPPDPRLMLTGFFERERRRWTGGRDEYKIQRVISRQLDKLAGRAWEQQVEQRGDEAFEARRLSNTNPGSAYWMRVLPMNHSSLISDRQWVASTQMRGGTSPLSELPLNSRCECGKPLTLAHAQACYILRLINIRHDELNHITYRWLRARDVHVVLELVVSAQGKERIDILAKHQGQEHWLDTGVTESTTPSALAAGSARTCLAAAAQREKRKKEMWEARAERDGKIVTVTPLIMEATGAVGKLFRRFVRMITATTESGPSAAVLWSRLSVAMQKCNANLLEEAIRRRRC
jgi:hypothetical protein